MNSTTILSWLEARLLERSTWVGLIALSASFGISFSPSNAQLIEALGAAVAGGIMIFSKDKNIDAAIAAALEDFAKNFPTATVPTTVAPVVEAEVPATVSKASAPKKPR